MFNDYEWCFVGSLMASFIAKKDYLRMSQRKGQSEEWKLFIFHFPWASILGILLYPFFSSYTLSALHLAYLISIPLLAIPNGVLTFYPDKDSTILPIHTMNGKLLIKYSLSPLSEYWTTFTNAITGSIRTQRHINFSIALYPIRYCKTPIEIFPLPQAVIHLNKYLKSTQNHIKTARSAASNQYKNHQLCNKNPCIYVYESCVLLKHNPRCVVPIPLWMWAVTHVVMTK